MKFTSFILLLICLLFQISVKSQEGWTLKKDKNGIKVFSRETKNFKFNEIKVECEFEGRMSQLAAVLFDVNKQYQWAYKTIKSQLLKINSPADLFYYTEIECPWPFENRDLVAHMTFKQNVENRIITIEANNVNDYQPNKKDIVRINYSRATWTIIPLNNKKFKVEYRVQVDPGDSLPAWVLNLFATNGPYETFLNLKKTIRLPDYVNSKFVFLLD